MDTILGKFSQNDLNTLQLLKENQKLKDELMGDDRVPKEKINEKESELYRIKT